MGASGVLSSSDSSFLTNPGTQNYASLTTTPLNSDSGVRIDTDRSVYELDQGSPTDRGDWLLAGGTASDYEVRFVQDSGTAVTGTLNTFLALSSDREVTLEGSGVGTINAALTVTIRHATNTSDSIDFTVNLQSEEVI